MRFNKCYYSLFEPRRQIFRYKSHADGFSPGSQKAFSSSTDKVYSLRKTVTKEAILWNWSYVSFNQYHSYQQRKQDWSTTTGHWKQGYQNKQLARPISWSTLYRAVTDLMQFGWQRTQSQNGQTNIQGTLDGTHRKRYPSESIVFTSFVPKTGLCILTSHPPFHGAWSRSEAKCLWRNCEKKLIAFRIIFRQTSVSWWFVLTSVGLYACL